MHSTSVYLALLIGAAT
jgi:hypothetical protein